MPEYPLDLNLNNGTPVIIRLLGKDDKEGLKSGFEKLSTYSLYCRFFTPIHHLSKGQLKYLTEIDQYNHLALCAILNDGVFQTGIGVARYIRATDDPESAEIAITIIDEYQNLGLGKKLMELLIESGVKNNIKKFTGLVIEENLPMIKILEKYNFVSERYERNILRVEFPITRHKSINY